ncbi:MAG: hypothetical protein GW808_02895 [Sphingomonadales bacterium]|nr:hypothetical protein [Sphingomonadales bacterium]NCO99345.1 hypothetical protein [Sphingomonadales bacterium]NCP42796.1 hypothetical protein [Sphingomonadales bacterium]NCP48140.1 hypothetical protein [Sphingomonadales bacterium]NCQ08119.1 hypothetical protein [Sphingomonadales bacterium]
MNTQLAELTESAIEEFRRILPQSHNLDMWVNETVLEYRRAQALWEQGTQATPSENTLLALFIQIAGNASIDSFGEGFSEYGARFGCEPDYCWTISLDDMFGKSAAAANQPATAWVAYSKMS